MMLRMYFILGGDKNTFRLMEISQLQSNFIGKTVEIFGFIFDVAVWRVEIYLNRIGIW
jgi:uncharacterized membrane protein YcgQ (UPF0703/DUF1980 family)